MSADPLRAGRAALLDLLADLCLRELPLPLAEQLAADPALAEALRPAPTAAALAALRVEYANHLLLDLPPYGSVFCDVPPVVGGESAQRWDHTLAALGLGPPSLERAAAPDHAGLVLRALAAAELDDRAGLLLPQALQWLPQWLTALRRDAGDTFYGRVAALAAVALGETARNSAGASTGAIAAGEPALPEEYDLRTLSRWLSTPAWSGWFLSKPRLRLLARPFGGGLGTVDREMLLQHAFEASGLDGRTAEFVAALRAELSYWQSALQEWQKLVDAWNVALRPWDAQLARTNALLAHLDAAARAEAGR